MSILAKGRNHQIEIQRLNEHHESEVAGLQGKAETDRAESKRKECKLKRALKDMEKHYLKEEKTYETAMRSAEFARENDIKEQQSKAQNTLRKTTLENDEQGLTLDKVEPQARDSWPETSEGLSDDPSATNPAQMQLQRSSPKIQILLEKLQLQNKQLWGALDMGKEEWQIGRKGICKAYVRTQVDIEFAEEEIERLREDHKVDPVRRSQWERLVENKTALCKRLGEQRAEDQEKYTG